MTSIYTLRAIVIVTPPHPTPPIKTVPFVFRCSMANAVCWIICHIKRQLFSHKMTSILFWNIKWLFVRFTFCHRTTVTLDTQWQNARTFLERINSRPTLYIYNNILIPYASHLLHTHRPTMEGGRPYYFTHDKYKCLRRDFRHMRNT